MRCSGVANISKETSCPELYVIAREVHINVRASKLTLDPSIPGSSVALSSVTAPKGASVTSRKRKPLNSEVSAVASRVSVRLRGKGYGAREHN